jgi:DNA invertase Pin-like site-specific DNA recombinase
MNQPKNALALIRVSTDSQDLSRQKTDIERLKTRYNLNIIRTLSLHGVSGTSTLDNQQVQQLLREMQQSGIDGLACSAVDRVFRPKRYASFAILDAFADAQKLLWTKREGVLHPWMDEDFDRCVDAGARAGSEWRELRRRSRDGKEERRARGLCPDVGVCMPRGVAFDKATGKWSYQEPDASRVVKMCELILKGQSYHSVAAAVGGGFSYQTVRHTLRNRIWAFGERSYKPVGDRTEALTVKVIEQPLMSVSLWEAVQRELDGRKDRWRKTKLATPRRSLAAGLLSCGCDAEHPKAMYVRYASRHAHPSKKDCFYCSTHHPRRGPKCPARTVRVEAVDRAVEQMMSGYLAKAAVLRTILEGLAARETHTDDTLAQAEITRLEAKRARVLEQREDGLISREACNTRVRALDLELRRARAVVPVDTTGELDLKALAIGLAGAFALFAKHAFAEKRSLLERAVKDIVITDGAIPSVTLRGGFLSEILGANLLQPLKWLY